VDEVETWLDHPVTQAFFREVNGRKESAREAKSEMLADDAQTLFRINWWIQGGIDELDTFIDLGNKDADTIEEFFGGEDE